MLLTQVDPRDQTWANNRPVFRVYFWSEVGLGARSSDEFEVRDADVVEVLQWAEAERRERTFTLYLRHDDAAGPGLVLLAGTDPTAGPSS
jgi:hypothetical protein